MMLIKERNIVLASPLIIISVNLVVASIFGQFVGKWAFIPIIIFGWVLWLFFILKYSGQESIKEWLKKPKGPFGWSILALLIGLIPLPIFLLHSETFAGWQIWLS